MELYTYNSDFPSSRIYATGFSTRLKSNIYKELLIEKSYKSPFDRYGTVKLDYLYDDKTLLATVDVKIGEFSFQYEERDNSSWDLSTTVRDMKLKLFRKLKIKWGLFSMVKFKGR